MLNFKQIIQSVFILMAILIMPQAAHAADEIILEIHKSERQLVVKQNHKVMRRFMIASGSGGSGNKIKRGDNITPIGIYRISHFKEDSRFHLFMQLNYPNALDVYQGMQRQQLDPVEYDHLVDQIKRGRLPDQKTSLGGAIGIHGIALEDEDKLLLHQDENWTQGCIAMTNAEIDELRSFVKLGTQVFIFD